MPQSGPVAVDRPFHLPGLGLQLALGQGAVGRGSGHGHSHGHGTDDNDSVGSGRSEATPSVKSTTTTGGTTTLRSLYPPSSLAVAPAVPRAHNLVEHASLLKVRAKPSTVVRPFLP